MQILRVKIVQRLLSASALGLDCIELSLYALQSAHAFVCQSHGGGGGEYSFDASVGCRRLSHCWWVHRRQAVSTYSSKVTGELVHICMFVSSRECLGVRNAPVPACVAGQGRSSKRTRERERDGEMGGKTHHT